MTSREVEYGALRDTIRERGSMRVWVVVVGIIAWAALTTAVMAWVPWPLATLIPLLVLATAFEAAFSLHTGVERVGRYLQIVHESQELPGWEHYAMAYGRRFPGSGTDPLFGLVFALATIFNFIPVVTADAVAIEYVATGALHLLFLARLVVARQQAARQRAIDLERFQQLVERR